MTTSDFDSTTRSVRTGAAKLTAPAEQFPLSKRDVAFIVGFWMLYALLTVANHVFDPGPPDRRSDTPLIAWIVISVTEATVWALLTPAIMSIVGRVRSDRMSRTTYVLLLALLGIVIALGVSFGGHVLRDILQSHATDASSPRASDSDAVGRRGPPLWFGFLNALVIYGGVLAAGLARVYSLRLSARRAQATQLQAQLAEARLAALRSQLDPHFLFNTLNAVSSLVERDPRGVRRMITRLSELLRFSMEEAREPEITLRRELDLLDRYLEIMQVRFPGLNVLRILDDESLDVMVPSMILQPLVENAIRHGVERMTEPGRVEIETLLKGETLVMRIRDDGPGEDVGAAGAGGVGLRNTRARLEQLYCGNASFSLTRGDDGLTVAEVSLPAMRDRSEMRVQGEEAEGDERD